MGSRKKYDGIIDQEYKIVPIDSIKPHPDNPNRGDVEAIGKSIEKLNFYGNAYVQASTGIIFAGEHRWKAAKEKGRTHIPVMLCDVDDIWVKEALIGDNKLALLAKTVDELTAKNLKEVMEETGDIRGTGYSDEEYDALIKRVLEETQVGAGGDNPVDTNTGEEMLAKWKVEKGQLWIVAGKHRLVCGDSTDPQFVNQLLDGNKPLLTITDPPYGVEYDPSWRNEAAAKGSIQYAARREGKVQNDDRVNWSVVYELSPSEVLYVWHAGRFVAEVAQSIEDAEYDVRSQIIWSKSNFAISRGHYHWKHEPCFYSVKRGCKAHWIGDRSQTTIWDIPMVGAAEGEGEKVHSTQKPIECMQRPIRNHSGDVYEPFSGTGTTIIAAHKEGRTCYAMEIDPIYVALQLQRFTDLGLEVELHGS